MMGAATEKARNACCLKLKHTVVDAVLQTDLHYSVGMSLKETGALFIKLSNGVITGWR